MKLTRLSMHVQSADCQHLDWLSTDHVIICREEHNGNSQDQDGLARLLKQSSTKYIFQDPGQASLAGTPFA